jgi:1-aminocyclopropane-1-carboxylate deaminase/D-cysteine desulfhydrase-like pyridoxal-dependent ACC family enzyme
MTRECNALTPIERHGDVWLKRDDLFEAGGVRGGKARACELLARHATQGLVTASARRSPQSVIVASLARQARIPCRVHSAWGESTPELERAAALGAEIIRHRPGYNSVIIRRATDDAAERGWSLVPFGMECREAVQSTARQTGNLPAEMVRLVIPVGSGMSLAGVLHGLARRQSMVPILGVVVGARPDRRLDRWAPPGWRSSVTLVRSGLPYHRSAPVQVLDDVPLDPVYEAKCLPLLGPGDCLWVVGRR